MVASSFVFKVPTFSYPGGKAKAAKLFVRRMPKAGKVYCEPFAGRGNVFFRARASGLKFDRWILNDPTTAGFFRGLVDPDIISKLPFAVTGKDALAWNKRARKGDPVALVLSVRLGFSGGFQGGRAGDHRLRQWSRRGRKLFSNKIRNARRLLLRSPIAEILDDDGLNVIAHAKRGWFLYVDPPYLGCDPNLYTRVDGQEAWHRKLLLALQSAEKRGVQWILSGYKTKLYTKILGQPTWTYNDLLQAGRLKRNERLKQTTECIWEA